ncbi:Hpt domain protein [Anatilimnocola aggregata]|uniref:Hpt domain protein n=1 Tax=Anatilimnocola aggregata TaxID=2528021 RepID=A0A517Y9F7_9BACT|nr:Hpt domain-containing protein [Anatilimnocola aggregata]QDU26864.1 Hpt domain protein [Anatilimnocola aggregata]
MATIFDYAGSLRRMGNDRGLFQDMILLLREDAPEYLKVIHQSYHAQDYPSLKRAAHTLKGLVLNFGGTRATLAAVALESLANTAEKEPAEKTNIPAAIEELVAAVAELQAALAEHCDEGSSAAPSLPQGSHKSEANKS